MNETFPARLLYGWIVHRTHMDPNRAGRRVVMLCGVTGTAAGWPRQTNEPVCEECMRLAESGGPSDAPVCSNVPPEKLEAITASLAETQAARPKPGGLKLDPGRAALKDVARLDERVNALDARLETLQAQAAVDQARLDEMKARTDTMLVQLDQLEAELERRALIGGVA